MPEQSGIRVIMTPVQLAAILQGATIGEPEGWLSRLWNRVEGGATVFCGGLELVGSAGLLLAPEPTMLTKVAGVALAVHGSDTAASGMATLWTGQHHTTMTAQAVSAAARSMGYSDERSNEAGIAVDVLVPILLTGVAGAVRATAVRSGRVVLAVDESEQAARATSNWTPAQRARFLNLDKEEAATAGKAPDQSTPWGHTKLKHVGQTSPQLEQRLIDEPNIPAATSFTTIEQAEKYISRGLITNSANITKWASTAKPGATLPWRFEAGEVVGYGIVRGRSMQNMNNIRIVLRKLASKDRIYFLLTSYPEP